MSVLFWFVVSAFAEDKVHALVERVNDPLSSYQLRLDCGLGAEPQPYPQCHVVHVLNEREIGRYSLPFRIAKEWLEAATKTLEMEPETGTTTITWSIQHSKKSFSGSTPKASLLALESQLFRWVGE